MGVRLRQSALRDDMLEFGIIPEQESELVYEAA